MYWLKNKEQHYNLVLLFYRVAFLQTGGVNLIEKEIETDARSGLIFCADIIIRTALAASPCCCNDDE